MKKLFLFFLSFIPILSFAQGVYQSTGDLKQTGNYPIIWDKNVKGAPQGRATKAQMLAIPASFRDTSMTCYVIETDSTYRLQQDLVTWVAVAPGNVALALKTINKSLLAKIDTSALGAPRGVATLDPGGKVPMSQLPASLFIYKGMYNALNNTPVLTDGTGTAGYVYQVNVAGTHNFGSGNITLNVGDYVIHNGTIWQKSAGTGYVTSVNGQQGTISLTTDNIAEGSNQYYTNGRAIGSTLTGYSSTPGSISSSDNILSAIGKLNGNIGALSSVYIQNQNTGSQSANFNISGSGTATSLALSGTDGSGNLFLPMQTSKPSAPASGMKVYNLSGLSWITSNGFSRTLSWPSTTHDNVATFTDANGTVPFLESDQTWSGVNTFGSNPIIKNNLPQLILTETSTGYRSILSKSATSNNLKLTHQIYQAGGQGSSLTFNGTTQRGSFPDITQLAGSSTFTVQMWVNPSSVVNEQTIFYIGSGGSSTNQFRIQIAAGGLVRIIYANNIGTLGTVPLSINSWYNLAVTMSGNTSTLYINGLNVGSKTVTWSGVTGQNATNSFSVLNLGGTLLSNYFNGAIDQTLVYNRVLTATEISINYNLGYGNPSPITSGLIAKWDFDDAVGSTAIDGSGNSYNVTLVNAPVWNLNGKVAKIGTTVVGTAFSFIDGINNGELGQWSYGDSQGGLVLQGKSVRASINGSFPLLQGLDGHIVIDPSITTSLPDVNGSYNTSSILKIGAGSTAVAPLQFASGVYNTTPLPGSLEYNGTFGFTDATNSRYTFVGLEKNQTFTGFNTFGGTIIGSSGLTRGLYINPSLQISTNNENQYVLDIAGASISNIGGSSIRGIVTVSNAGSGYAGGGSGSFTNVRLTNGTGNGALASVTITSGAITSILVPPASAGTGYLSTDVLSVNNADLGGTGSGAVLIPSVGWVNGVLYSIRHANPIIPLTANTGTLGTQSLYYNSIYSGNAVLNRLQALTGNFTITNTGNQVSATIFNTTRNINLGTLSPTDAGYRLDIDASAASNGSLRSTGTLSGNSVIQIVNLFNNTINPLINNQTLIGADFNFAFGAGGSVLTPGIVSPSNYTVTVAPTSAGSVTGSGVTNGSGSGATITVITTIGGVTSVNVNGSVSSGYAVGNTITLTANGGTIVYTIPAGGVGLSGVNTLAARFSNKISLTPTVLTSTPLANAIENDGTNLYLTNSSGTRNQFAYTASPSFTGTPTAPTAAPGTNNTQIATTAFVLANTTSGIAGITGSQGVSVSSGNNPTIGLGAITPSAITITSGNPIHTNGSISSGPIDASNFTSSNSTFEMYASWEKMYFSNTGATYSELASGHLITDTISLKRGYVNNNITRIVQNPSYISPNILTLPNTSGTLALRTDNVGQFSNDAGYITSSALSGYAKSADIPNNFAWFKNTLLDNVGETTPVISNSHSGSQLYIATNYAGGGYGEVDYFSVPGTSSSARGHHAFYTLNPVQGTSGGIQLDFGSFGDNNAFTTGGPLAPGVVDHSPNIPQRIPVFDINTNTIYYRTPQELASDLGYALDTGYAVLNGGNTFTGDQVVTGSIVASGNITTTSDQRLKKNIVDLPSATPMLKNIRAVSFDRIDMNKHQIGLLAQNVREYYPELVEEDKNKMLSVNYGMFIAPLLKGWQEQQARIEALERMVRQLTEKK